MPHIEVKTTQTLSREQKVTLVQRLARAFADSSDPHVAGNIQFIVEDGCFIQFRGDSDGPSANVQVHPGPMTPIKDYEAIVKAFFPVLVEELKTPPNKIYITISEIEYWGFDGQYVTVPNHA